MRGKWINKEAMIKQKLEANIYDNVTSIEEAEEQWEKAFDEWKEIMLKGKEFQENDILDFYHSELENNIEVEK